MATIQETIQLNDGISGPLNKIANLAERAADAGQRLADRIQSVGHSSSSARGSVNSFGSSVGDLVGQFTLANIASEALIRTFDALSGAPAKLAAAADQFAGMQARLKLAESRNARCVLETKTIAALQQSVQWLRKNWMEENS